MDQHRAPRNSLALFLRVLPFALGPLRSRFEAHTRESMKRIPVRILNRTPPFPLKGRWDGMDNLCDVGLPFDSAPEELGTNQITTLSFRCIQCRARRLRTAIEPAITGYHSLGRTVLDAISYRSRPSTLCPLRYYFGQLQINFHHTLTVLHSTPLHSTPSSMQCI